MWYYKNGSVKAPVVFNLRVPQFKHHLICQYASSILLNNIEYFLIADHLTTSRLKLKVWWWWGRWLSDTVDHDGWEHEMKKLILLWFVSLTSIKCMRNGETSIIKTKTTYQFLLHSFTHPLMFILVSLSCSVSSTDFILVWRT